MSKLEITLDIESIPTQLPAFKDAIKVECPGNISKAETIEKWETDKKPGLIDTAYRKTALNSTKGELIVIGWAFNDEEPQHVYRNMGESEGDLLNAFFTLLSNKVVGGYFGNVLWIGHNILAFDLPFIWHRAIVNKVHMPVKIPFDVKPWDDHIFDTKRVWKANSSASSSLHDICTAIGIPVKQDMDGSEVWDYVMKGEVGKVANYCSQGDVVATRTLYNCLKG